MLGQQNKINVQCLFLQLRKFTEERAKHWQRKVWRQIINIKSCNANSIYCYPHKQKKHFFIFARTKVLTLFKGVQQATGTGKTGSNYEAEKRSVEYRQTEYLTL